MNEAPRVVKCWSVLLLIVAFNKAEETSDDVNKDLQRQLNEWSGLDPHTLLERLEPVLSQQCHDLALADWQYATNITEETKLQLEKTEALASRSQKTIKSFLSARSIKGDESAQRQIKILSQIGPKVLNKEDYRKYVALSSDMVGIYSSAKVCDYKNRSKCDLSLEPELTNIFSSSRDYDELKYYWEEWRRVSGKNMKTLYEEFVSFGNKAAKLEGFSSIKDYWIEPYETENFLAKLDNIWTELKPVYQLLYVYTRKKLKDTYGHKIKRYGRLPAHVLGNMWAQNWVDLFPLLKLEDNTSLTVTEELVKQNYTAKEMFLKAQEFFLKIGMENMTETFWKKSIIEKPKDRDIVCHASAEDFCKGRTDGDYRIKMCTSITHNHMSVVHHEMGHIQYFMHYRNQPMAFRDGANPGVHEAIGDVLVLAFNTPKHLKSINLLESAEISQNTTINYLLRQALSQIAFIPFAYSLEKWRYELFDGNITSNDMNKRWWELKTEIQGISPPSDRSGADLFDAGAKFHIPSHDQYINYFVAHILKFQIYKKLCEVAGHQGPLYLCDFSEGNALMAGQKFSELLRKGYSQPWIKTFNEFGIEDMSADAIKEYFQELVDFLKKETEGECLNYDGCDELAEKFIKDVEVLKPPKDREESLAGWQYQTNITAENQENKVNVSVNIALWRKKWALTFQEFDTKAFQRKSKNRIVKKLSLLTKEVLTKEKITKLTDKISKMTTKYSSAKICPFHSQNCNLSDSGLSLSADITPLMAHSRNYEELSYLWKSWRDAAGKVSRKDFEDTLPLKEEVAVLNEKHDYAEVIFTDYEEEHFKEYVDNIWDQLKPLYVKLHAYVRFKLRKIYSGKFGERDPIPAHILGNMWAQTWSELYEDLKPYPEKDNNITEAMLKQNFTVQKMFDAADEFFISLTMDPMTKVFHEKSLFEEPSDRKVVCHASAWDMSAEDDFRIKMCTRITEEDFGVVHHEMGHIQYYMNYRHQPVYFREGANPGFHEAVGDTVALSVMNPIHLKTIQLIDSNYEFTKNAKINFQFKLALSKLALLPWTLVMDTWRWSLYNGSVSFHNSNRAWWSLRESYQGVMPPVVRSENDFDPAAKYHISNDVPYIRYFISDVLQFQFHETLCHAAGFVTLVECDIYKSESAGEKFKNMLKQGSSKHWRDILGEFTGDTRDINPKSMLNYFKELETFLDAFILEENIPVGWDSKLEEYFQ